MVCGEQLLKIKADNHQSRYRYDALGDLTVQIDNPNLPRRQQRHVHYQRDLIGQLIAKHATHYPAPIGEQTHNPLTTKPHYERTRFAYNKAGQLISASNGNSRTQLDYDKLGQLIQETVTRHDRINGQHKQHEQSLTHRYDEIGNRIATTLPDGKIINHLYYGSGHKLSQSITGTDGTITEIYHSEHNELHQQITRYHGALTSAYDYDPMGRLTKQYSSSSEHIAIERQYAYNQLGQLTHLTGKTRLSAHTQALQYSRGHQYRYDKIGRLTQHKLTDYANHTGITEVFAFDPASNRVPISTASQTATETIKDSARVGRDNDSPQDKQPTQTGRPTTLTTHDKYITYTYDSHDRVLYKTQTPLGSDGKPLTQSSNSLLHTKQSVQHYYNANNELTTTITNTEEGFNLTTVTTHYKYDAFGRRIAKNSKIQVKTKLINHQKSRIRKYHIQEDKTVFSQVSFLWDGNRQLQEYKDDLVFTTIYEQDSFEPVARLVWTNKTKDDGSSNIHIYNYHNDQLGTPNELSDIDGNIIWLADYKAWGGVAKDIYIPQTIDDIEVNETDLQPIRFQGQYLDTETGLHYNRFRYYDNDVGMFISRDPIGLMGGNNVFAYAPNPIGWIDPFGLTKVNSRTEPKLPRSVIVKEKGVTVEHYYPKDHPSAHMHVKGGGQETKIGPNGKPIKGYPELSPKQKRVVKNNLKEIRKAGNKIRKWLNYKSWLERLNKRKGRCI